jgi:hypothetical protein
MDNPQEITNLRSLFEQICQSLNGEERSDFQSMYSWRFESAAWGWKPKIERMSASEIDRRGEVMNGPVFTSAEYEWPEANGFPMVPVIQLNLSNCARLGEVELGDGFVQVWVGHQLFDGRDALIRVLPNELVKNGVLSPIPSIKSSIHALVSPDWATYEDESAQQIVGYNEKRFTIDLGSPIKDNFARLTKDQTVQVNVKDFDKLSKSLKEKFALNYCHLFGTFEAVQYSGRERSTPLFCFEGDYDTELGTDWGDGGNAQLFYIKNDDESISFAFDWSNF